MDAIRTEVKKMLSAYSTRQLKEMKAYRFYYGYHKPTFEKLQDFIRYMKENKGERKC